MWDNINYFIKRRSNLTNIAIYSITVDLRFLLIAGSVSLINFVLFYYVSLSSEFRVVMSYYVSLRSEFRVVMSVTISTIKTMFGFYLLPVVWRRTTIFVLICVICVCLHIVVCFVLFFFVLCTICCQLFWIVDFWLPIWYSLTFILTKWER